ncbi:hypothetical protein [Streptomyces daghestanicus]|jgi:hypothetical protein|uniref:Secreted protein n=1 Tax=Streptomyces daghestanicus TaxID=66885 RepID=A0ABQ3Q414_9ACTN|nr:hypothetical protein [Streptomyces daghestanicus]GGU32610.1 hypothetical protein GCM10010259_24030 [Streptomyces daghestanicus]GHI32032.1 hypothetical protein Sdagh_37620 [Streptomyces daghestanicus]
MRTTRRKLGALIGGLVAAALAVGAVATVAVIDNPGSKTPTAAYTPRPY